MEVLKLCIKDAKSQIYVIFECIPILLEVPDSLEWFRLS